MYPGLAALTKLLGVPESCERIVNREGTIAYLFHTGNRTAGITWRSDETGKPLAPAPGVVVYDIMGNELKPGTALLSESPLYLIGASAEAVARALP
jgi:hypothetical protein